MYTVFQIVFPIFAIVLVGYLYARRHGPDMAAANKVNLEIFTPALIFSVLAGKDFHPAEYTDLAMAGIVVVLGSGLIAWPIARILGYSNKMFLPPMMFNNSGNMGLPLALFAFGEAALPAAMVLFLVENTLHFSVGNAMLIGRLSLIKLLTNPMLVATLLGMLVAFTKTALPDPLLEAIKLLGQIAIPLMLFSLGVRMTEVDLSDWKLGFLGGLLCPLSGILAALLVTQWVVLPEQQLAMLLVFATLPPAVLNYIMAEHYNIESERVAAVVMTGNMLSLVTIPLALYWVL